MQIRGTEMSKALVVVYSLMCALGILAFVIILFKHICSVFTFLKIDFKIK